ncbi:uncharacterized protein [Asterias amurensis]|uniref:uncharacterized protein n=1 Tax=Asterias amurensis TaxID=7602 RepID=UPI003AB30FD0
MSWFETGGLSGFAKSALSSAQKSIDRVLDIQAEDSADSSQKQTGSGPGSKILTTANSSKTARSSVSTKEDLSQDASLLSSYSARRNQLKSEDNFFSAFLDDPSPSKTPTPVAQSVRSPGRTTSSVITKKSQQQKSKDNSKNQNEKAKEDLSSENISRKTIEAVSVDLVVCATQGTNQKEENNEKEVCEDLDDKVSPNESTAAILLTQSLNPLEISIDDSGSMIGSSSSFVPISKEDVEGCQYSAISPQSSDDLMSVSQTQLKHDSELLDTVKPKPDTPETTPEKDFKNREGSPSDSKSEHSEETNATSSSSDFVVINEFTGSELSSLSNYDTRESPESQSPKHFSSSSNGKRSPDSDFSIISEGRFHDTIDTQRIPSLLDAIDFNRRESTAYSADVDSDNQDEKEVSCINTSFKSLSSSSDTREESNRTPTPTQEEQDVNSAEKTPRPFEMKEQTPADTANVNPAEEDHQTAQESQSPIQPGVLLKKLAGMAEVLQARESQVMTLSNQNVDLQESLNILKSQLQQSEAARETEMTDLNDLTEEFTQRISSMERKLQASQKERDVLKKEVQKLTKDIASRDGNNQTEQILKEKEETIIDLMAEGEKLSKQQLQNSNIIKKLRAKEKENETLINSQKEQLDETTGRLEHLENVLDGKEELEKQQKDIIKKLNVAVDRLDKELSNQRMELDDSKEKVRSTQAALDASYKDLAELHKGIATKNSKVQETKLSAEMNAKEEMRLALERNQQEARREHEALLLQISDLQMSISRQDQHQARKESHLRQEISDLQMRLQEAEQRNQELSQSVSAATRPLLRQIENLNTTFNAQSGNWEQVERSLTERLADSQAQLASATEKERNATESALIAGSKLSSMESQLALLRQDKSRLQAELEMAKAKADSLEESKESEMARTEAQLSTYTKALEEAQRDKTHLEKQLEVEKMRVDTERRKLLLAQDAISEKERRLTQQVEDSSSHGNRSGASTPVQSLPTTPGPFHTPTQMDILERTMSWSTSESLYDSVVGGSASSVIEGLHSQHKQREGEIVQLQAEISQLERTRAAMAEEIVKLSNLNETLDEQAMLLPEYKRKLVETETRYNAVLQMYGEKAEEVQELKLDLQDVKEMYRQQIEDLIHS